MKVTLAPGCVFDLAGSQMKSDRLIGLLRTLCVVSKKDSAHKSDSADGDVWPPFYEQPFARSGEGTAWDGLSRYDLTSYNPWYFGRLLEFSRIAREKGLVLVNAMYFQHQLLESGAHWVDSPWRPVNRSRTYPPCHGAGPDPAMCPACGPAR